MALTDRSAIPLKPSDFKVLEGERRLSDVRLAERLGFEELKRIRSLIERWAPFLEQQSGKPVHRSPVSQARGPAGDAYWLTIPELIFIAAQSEAKNAPVVQYEAAVIAAYWLKGDIAPDDAAPTLRALTAPDKPTIVRSDDNIVRVEHKESLVEFDDCVRAKAEKTEARLRQRLRQGQFDFGVPPPSRDDKALDELTNNPLANKREVWEEHHDGHVYLITKIWDANGDVWMIEYLQNPPIPTSTDGYVLLMPWINGRQVRLRLNHCVPYSVVERTYLNQLPDDGVFEMPNGKHVRCDVLKAIAFKTLDDYLAL